MRPTRWWWVRHAPVRAAQGTVTGQLDLSCDTTHTAIQPLACRLPLDAHWIVTPLRRTQETAQALLKFGAKSNGRTAEPDFMEQHFGAWQGQTYDALGQQGDVAYDAFWNDPVNARPPGGESFQMMTARVHSTILRLSAALAGCDVVAVAHAGPIRAALGLALQLDGEAMLSVQIDPLSLTRIDYFSPASWRIVTMNNTQEEDHSGVGTCLKN